LFGAALVGGAFVAFFGLRALFPVGLTATAAPLPGGEKEVSPRHFEIPGGVITAKFGE
jgi:hypothetical protein